MQIQRVTTNRNLTGVYGAVPRCVVPHTANDLRLKARI
jgi:hypothetical protein